VSIILNADSYKLSHFQQLPPGAQYLYSYIESRGGTYDRTVFFGPQMFLKGDLSKRVTPGDISEAEDIVRAHGLPFNREGWDTIVRDHGGRLPLAIYAVPEGTVVPTKNALMSVVNTDPRFAWLTSYVETALLRSVWYPTTVATQSWFIKQDIRAALERTCDNPEAILPFRLHDFGARGVSSRESAGIGGAAHLVNFMGTDNIDGILYARRFYGEQMAGYSIPAAEHSTITSWGEAREKDAYENMLDAFGGPGKLVAVVSDSYDLFGAIKNIWGGSLREKVRAMGGTLVVRPDSGDPTVVPVQAIEMLADLFGFTVNSKGFKVLPDCVRVIQGDGINRESINVIMNSLIAKGFSVENIAFGMGGALLQGVNRDTQRFAMKASAISINGVWQPVQKNPKTDPGKRSKAGRLALVRGPGGFQTLPLDGHAYENLLVPVWKNGELLKDWTFSEVRARSNEPQTDMMKAA
jgi:nicotinamide phosphoribosyltransferase